MEIVDLLGLGASAASGGLLGLLGTFATSWFKSKELEKEREYKLKLREADERMYRLEAEERSVQHERTLETGRAQLSREGLVASYQQSTATVGQSYRWVVAVKDLMRPVLTLSLWVLTAIYFSELKDISDLSNIQQYIVYTTVFAASTATAWWFGDRAIAPKGLKNL